MNFTRYIAKPADRIVFRLIIGKALLNKANDEYLKIWNIDFTKIVYKSVGSNNMRRFSSAMLQRWVIQEHFTAPVPNYQNPSSFLLTNCYSIINQDKDVIVNIIRKKKQRMN